MSRRKLKTLGLNLPIFPATSVGSLPKPDYLLKARARTAKGNLAKSKLEILEKRATEFWMGAQEELGLDVLVDGEQYRGDMVAYFAGLMKGFKIGGLVRSYGNRYYHKPVITGKVKWPGPMTVRWWKFAQSFTNKPVKGMLTGPYTLMDWSFNEYYPSRKAACLALAKEIRKEAEALIDAGAKIIQVDEPALLVRPEELPFAFEAMQLVTRDLPAYFITHICYGAFEFIYPKMLELAVENFDLETSNSGLDLLNLLDKNPFTKDFSFGVVDVHAHEIEPSDLVRERVKKALSFIPQEAIWVDPDCGLKTRTVDEAIEKLRTVVAGTRAVRQELGVA